MPAGSHWNAPHRKGPDTGKVRLCGDVRVSYSWRVLQFRSLQTLEERPDRFEASKMRPSDLDEYAEITMASPALTPSLIQLPGCVVCSVASSTGCFPADTVVSREACDQQAVSYSSSS